MRKKTFRWMVMALCMAWLLALLGCGKEKPHMLDGPGMEREVWSEFTISRCSAMYEPIYSYTVKYDEVSDGARLYMEVADDQNGQMIQKSIQLEAEAVWSLINMNLWYFPDEEAVTGNFKSLSVTNSAGQRLYKCLSAADEKEILAIIAPYVDALSKKDGAQPPAQ